MVSKERLGTESHAASHRLVAELLQTNGYSLQANRKTREGPQHLDRDAQFRYINEQVRRYQKRAQPEVGGSLVVARVRKTTTD
jgi:hypothetical protein